MSDSLQISTAAVGMPGATVPDYGEPKIDPDTPERPEKRKRTVQKLTNGDRKWICQRRLTHKDEKFADMQAAFRLERNPDIELKSGTVSGIIKQSDKWLSIADGQEAGTRTRSSKEPELEAALYAWRNEQLAKDEKVRDEDLRDKARELAAAMGINTDRATKGLSFSSGWLDRFKKRNQIKQTRYNRHGKKEDIKAEPMHHNPSFPHLAAQPPFTHDPTAGVMERNATTASIHSSMPFMHQHLQHVMPGSAAFSAAIPAVPHVASVPQGGVPLPQDTFPLPQCVSIPQPPMVPSQSEDASIHNAQFNGQQLYSGLVGQPTVMPPGPSTLGATTAVLSGPSVPPPQPDTRELAHQTVDGMIHAHQQLPTSVRHDVTAAEVHLPAPPGVPQFVTYGSISFDFLTYF
jgi:hypothetical protein